MRLNREFLGNLSCKVLGGELIVGFPNTIECTYTAGKYGIDDGGHIKILRQGVTDWQAVQTNFPTETGYTTVKTTGQADVRILDVFDSTRPYENAIIIKVENGCLSEGDKVIVTLGDTQKGSAGILTQTVAEKNHLFIASVDVYGGKLYRHVPSTERIEVKNGSCARVDLILPSFVVTDKEFIAKIRTVDMFGNRCEDFSGDIFIEGVEGFVCPEKITLDKNNKGCTEITCVISKEGNYRINIDVPSHRLQAQSNICKAAKEVEYKLFWGDMHGQNDHASGVGSMDDSLNFAREVGCLDFSSWQGNDFEVSDENWSKVCDAIKRHHAPNSFVTFLGYEWSGLHCAGGDHNIYYLNDDEDIHRSSSWYYRDPVSLDSVGRDDDGSDCYPISELWECFKGRKDVMAIPHVGGRFGNFDFHNPELTSVIEVHSHHGIFDWFLEEAMKRKLKVGFIATSDDHTSRLGLSYPVGTEAADFGATFDVISGLTAVYAKELTREGIWDALKSRRCYGTTNSRTIVKFTVNDAFMGEEIEIESPPEIAFEVDANSAIDRVELYRNTDKIKVFNPCSVDLNKTNQRVKIVWSGVKTKFRKKSVFWKGNIFVENGRIADIENYAIDRESDGIQWNNNQIVSFASKTSGDEDGVIIDIVQSYETPVKLRFLSNQINTTVDLDEIKKGDIEIPTGLMNCKVVFSIEGDPCENPTHFSGNFTDSDYIKGQNSYYIKVFMKDGNRAWVSPVFATDNT